MIQYDTKVRSKFNFERTFIKVLMNEDVEYYGTVPTLRRNMPPRQITVFSFSLHKFLITMMIF